MIDTLLAIFLGLGALAGLRDGLVRKLAGIAGTFGGIILGLFFRHELSELIVNSLGFGGSVAPTISFLFVFLLTQSVAGFAYRFFAQGKSKPGLASRMAGVLLGAIQATMVASTLLWVFAVHDFPSLDQRAESKLYRHIVNIAPRLFDQAAVIIEEAEKQGITPSSLQK